MILETLSCLQPAATRAPRIVPARPRPLALEARFMFDGAAAALGADTVADATASGAGGQAPLDLATLTLAYAVRPEDKGGSKKDNPSGNGQAGWYTGDARSGAAIRAISPIDPPDALPGPQGNDVPVTLTLGSVTYQGWISGRAKVDSGRDAYFFEIAPSSRGTGNDAPTGFVLVTSNGTWSGGRVQVDESKVTLKAVEPPPPVNNLPVAKPDVVTTPEDTVISGDLLTNDTDADGDRLAITQFKVGGTPCALDEAQEITGVGTLTINANGSYKFTPAANFYGDLPPITYTVSDGKGGTATATLSITVTSVNDAPVAFNDTVSIAEDSAATTIDVLSNDRDIDGGTLAVTSFTINGDTVTYTANAGSNTASLPGKGTLTLNANGTFTFTPTANFYGDLPPITYTVSDGKGGTAMGTLSITVASVNDAPASASNSIVVDEDTSHTFQVSDFGFSDSLDTPSNALTRILITSVQAPAGTLTYEGAAIDLGSSPFAIEAADIAKLQFTPAPNAHGSGYASFTFQVQDDGGTDRGGQNTSAVYTLTINVTSVNDAPVNNTASESLSVRNDHTLSDLGLSVFDVDGAEDLASVTVSVSHGTLSVQGNASSSLTLTGTQAEINALLAALVYTPEPTYTGADTLTLVTFDDAGASATSTTSLTVSAASLLGGSGSSGGSGGTSGGTSGGSGSGSGSGSGGFGSAPPTTSGNGTSSAPPPPTETSGNPVTTAGPPATDPTPPSSTPTTTPTTTPFTPVTPSPGSTFGSTPPPVVPAPGMLEGLLAEFHPRDFRDNPLSQEAALPPALQRMLALWSFDAMYTEAPDDGFRVAVHPDTGVSLAVFRGMPDQFVEADGMSFFSVPSDSFFHTLQAVRIRLHATLADGSPLPPWIALDALTGVFALTPPRGFQGELAIRLMARDGQGLEAATLFRLHVGERAQAQLRDGGVAGRSALSDQLREASRQREPALAPRAPQEAPPRVLQPT